MSALTDAMIPKNTPAPKSSGSSSSSSPLLRAMIPQATPTSISKPQPQQNFLQQSKNFLNGVYKGAVGDVGNFLNSQPVKNTEKTVSKVINGVTVKFVKPALNSPVGKALGNEAKDFYDVTTNNPNYEKSAGTGLGDFVARGIQNPQVSGAEGIAIKGFSKAGAVIGGVVNAGLGYLSDKNNNIKTTPQDVAKNAIVGGLLGGAGGHAAETQIKPKVQDVLTSGTHKPEDLVGTVIKHNLENTTEGKKVIQLAHQAQQQGQHIAIDNPVQDFNKNVEDYRSFGGYTAGKSTPNAALRDIQQVADTPQIKAHTQQQVQEAIKTGELKPNSDGTITLYRGGKPSSQNGLVSASYDKSVAEGFAKDGELHGIQVKPEDIKAFIGKQEKEVLIDKSVLKPQDAQAESPVGAGLSDTESQLLKEANVRGYNDKNPHANIHNVKEDLFQDQTKARDFLGQMFDKYKNQATKEMSVKDLMTPSEQKTMLELNAKADRAHQLLTNHVAQQPISEVERVRQETNKNLREMGVPESEIPKPQEVNTKNGENLKPVGTGETKQSTLGQKVEAKAIENKLLKDGIDKLPEYQKANMKEQGKLASDYLASNEKEATDVALGRKSAPDGIIPEAIYTAVENKAIADKNISLLANLAKSSRVGEATAMGQRIRTLAERNPDSPVTHITNLLNKRIKSVEDRTGKPIDKLRDEEVTKIKKVQGEQKKPDKYDWNNFISSIQC